MTSQWVTKPQGMPHGGITVGNDVARDIHCDVTMGTDVAICTYHGITMLNDVTTFIMYYYA